MITEKDLQEAISECLGQRNPNANTCIKLAAFYTIRREMFGETEPIQTPVYSQAGYDEKTERIVNYTGESEFSKIINGMDAGHAWRVMDELMKTLAVLHPKLYNGVMIKLEEG